MDSHASPPPPPPYPLPTRHPSLPPVQTTLGMPPLQPSVTGSTATAVPSPALPHLLHAHGGHLPHPVLPQPLAVGAISIPVAHAHLHAGAASGFYEQCTAERIARLSAENEALRRENDALRAKLAEFDKERAKGDTPKVQSRYWTPDEHQRFLEALSEFGAKDVRAIASYVGTRNPTQVRTHAQKYFLRKAREAKGGLHSARKRSMSESDLVRMGRAAAAATTPPGSPVKRENPRAAAAAATAAARPAQSQPPPQDAIMQDIHPPPPPRRPRASGLASPLSTSVISIPSMVHAATTPQQTQPPLPPLPRDAPQGVHRPPPAVSAGRPPPAAPASQPKVTDNSGINLLSMVAAEHEMQTVRSRN